MKNLKYFAVVLALWGCSSIAFNKSPQAKEEAAALMTFQYPKKDVFDACVRTLELNGWTVTLSNYAEGSISGIRRLASGAAAAPAQQVARVRVVEKEAGKVEVRITAGLGSPDPGGKTAGGAPEVRNMPEVCRPLVNSLQETLLKSGQTPAR